MWMLTVDFTSPAFGINSIIVLYNNPLQSADTKIKPDGSHLWRLAEVTPTLKIGPTGVE